MGQLDERRRYLKNNNVELAPLDWLKFKAKEPGTFTFTIGKNVSSLNSMSYSVDNGITWVTLQNVDGEEVTITTPTVLTDDCVFWKGDGNGRITNGITDDYYSYFSSSGTFEVSGNLLSLFAGDNLDSVITMESSTFSCLFKDCVGLIGIEKLPNICALYSYYHIFEGCTLLTSPPLLPATLLREYCYAGMFNNCTSLTTTPVLPATKLWSSCYSGMFKGCTALTTPPTLSATTLESYCYNEMFKGCTSLMTMPTLSATTLYSGCYSSMFEGCTSLTTMLDLPASTILSGCYKSMFKGCTSLKNVRYLRATTLKSLCYYSMFEGCTSLTAAPNILATQLDSLCCTRMFYGCINLTTPPQVLKASTLKSNCYNSMFYGCQKLSSIKALFTTTPGTSYTRGWVYGVSPTGTFTKRTSASWNLTGVDGIPSGWTVQTANS